NEATKKTQKALLKQYENFNASSSESLDSIFNRLQKLVSRLAILGVITSPEDLNVKFLRSLPAEWDTHVVVWMNKLDFDTMGLDDLYNNFKIVEQKVKKSVGASNDDKNLAFLTTSGASSINNINTVNPEVSTGTTKVNTASTETSTASFSDATVYAFLSTQPQGSQLVHEDLEQLHYDDLLVKLDDTGFKASTYKRGLSILEGQIIKYKESEVLFSEEIALLKRSVGHKEYLMGLLRTELEKVKEEKEGFEFKIAKFEKSSKDLDQLLESQITDKSKKGVGYNVVPSPHHLILNRPTPLDLSYSGLEEFKQPEVNEYGPRDNSKENTDDSLKQQQKTDSSSVKSPLKVDKDWKEKFFCPANQVREEEPKKAKENNDAPFIEDWVSDDEDDVEPIPMVEKKTVIPIATKKEFVKPKKLVRRSVRPIFEKVWDFNQHIEPMEHGSEKMKSPEKIEEKDADTQKEVKEVAKESGAKRKKSLPRKRRIVKRQKLEEDAEKEELKGFLDIIPREDVAEDVESLSTKYPIMDWKTYTLTENFMYYQIFRGDGSSKNYKVLSEMLEDFDRQDVEELYRLVKERYSASRPEGYDLMLWGDLHTLFEPDEEDEIWKNQHEYNVISWSLYDFCSIHILLMQNGIAT
ncbi:hypothetical protein Tco_1349314, partial [Tanacetum coccineum]